MDKIILIPLLISAGMLMRREPKDVFILVFLPTLTLFPTYFDTELVSGTPELYFWSAALIPILVVWMMRKFEGYRFHWMDLVILLYILTVFYGQWMNSDYKKAQKVLFNNMMAIFFPYALVRSIITNKDTLMEMIKVMTFLGAFVAIFNVIEFRMFTSYFDELLRRIWPSSVMWDTGMVMSRWGFKRAFGPFSHPISAGYFFSLIAPLAIWCYSQNLYRNKTIGKAVVLLNIVGIFVSLSRAPMLGFFMGLIIIFYGWSKNKAAIVAVLLIILTIVLLMLVPKFIEYASVTRATAETTEQRNVAYRKEMWEAYTEVVMERPYLGWGRFSIPSVKGMESIDSEYLGVALASGLIALSFYLVFLLGMLVRLYRFAMDGVHDHPWSRLSWCLIAGWVSAIFSQGTVYSGAQTVHYIYMLGGIGQVLILLSSKEWIDKKEEIIEPEYIGRGFNFSRIV
ncbi:MAG: O-antigen ligase family protein [Desulfobacterales bacterium]|nr:MAG: O-antigen ligase family protein [Desulfobacterales bacterium]